jgi:CheY-like chemotaxis protein
MRMAAEKMSVLLVEPDAIDRDLYGGWLEDAGFEVVTCPGPGAPDYECVGGRTGFCPLAAGVDLIVLDVRLHSDLVGYGTSASDLLTVYRATGKPVLALDPETPSPADAEVTQLSRPLDRSDLLAAVSSKGLGPGDPNGD